MTIEPRVGRRKKRGANTSWIRSHFAIYVKIVNFQYILRKNEDFHWFVQKFIYFCVLKTVLISISAWNEREIQVSSLNSLITLLSSGEKWSINKIRLCKMDWSIRRASLLTGKTEYTYKHERSILLLLLCLRRSCIYGEKTWMNNEEHKSQNRF